MENNIDIYTPLITNEEKIALIKFKEMLDNKNIIYDNQKFNDFYLVRFLRARKNDLKKTFEMFTNFLNWRQIEKIDEIDKYQYPEAERIKKFYPHCLHKTDKLGRPLYIEIIGKINLDELFKVTTENRLLKYTVRQYELLINKIFPLCSETVKKPIQQIFTIADLKNLTSKILTKKMYSFIKLTSSNSQNYYPEILGQLYFINTGLLFKAAWAVCKAFVDEKTRKKIVTLGSDYKKKILEHVDPANLPNFIDGGECICEPYGCMYSFNGPWNKELKPDIELIKELHENKYNSNQSNNIKIDENNKENNDLDELSNELNDNIRFTSDQTNDLEEIKEKNEGEIKIIA